MKGDTINIQYQGRDYLIDIVETKPEDQICVVEADIEVDFREPLDYKALHEKQLTTPTLAKKNSKLAIPEEQLMQEEARKKILEKTKNLRRLDGKELTEKQIQEMVKKEMLTMKKDDEDFDPRKHRLKHGIRNYDQANGNAPAKFEGKGVKVT